MKERRVALADVVVLNPRMPKFLAENQERSVAFVPMASVSERGILTEFVERPLREVIKGFTYFESGDVLLAKITPCMENGKACLVPVLPNKVGFGSTEFHVLRATEAIDRRYLFHCVWNANFRKAAAKNMTGSAGQKRVPSHFLSTYKIPLPPLPEQKRIAAILDKADAIRRKREKAIELTDSFLRSVFLEMFGDPIANEKNWEFKELGTLIEMIGGYAFKSSDFVEQGIPLVKIGNANRTDFDTRNLSFLPETFLESHRRFILHPGDMIMSLTGTTGKDDYGNINLVPNTYARWFLNQRVAKITIRGNITPSYLLGLLSNKRFKTKLISVSRGVRQANLRNEDLLLQRVPYPPLELQQKYEGILTSIKRLSAKQREANERAVILPQSLSMKLFDLSKEKSNEVFVQEVAHAL